MSCTVGIARKQFWHTLGSTRHLERGFFNFFDSDLDLLHFYPRLHKSGFNSNRFKDKKNSEKSAKSSKSFCLQTGLSSNQLRENGGGVRFPDSDPIQILTIRSGFRNLSIRIKKFGQFASESDPVDPDLKTIRSGFKHLSIRIL